MVRRLFFSCAPALLAIALPSAAHCQKPESTPSAQAHPAADTKLWKASEAEAAWKAKLKSVTIEKAAPAATPGKPPSNGFGESAFYNVKLLWEFPADHSEGESLHQVVRQGGDRHGKIFHVYLFDSDNVAYTKIPLNKGTKIEGLFSGKKGEAFRWLLAVSPEDLHILRRAEIRLPVQGE